ncbi:hypothetical protein CK203_065860 [Vitis vinifera]|uniref:Uncharacterized protein n=1 Tax=Vitis vinifera TaxID=29760 RepID=A0A438FXR1_VITVI|nr:hypothetical protein CK203_065860 [Vitis vinifera]
MLPADGNTILHEVATSNTTISVAEELLRRDAQCFDPRRNRVRPHGSYGRKPSEVVGAVSPKVRNRVKMAKWKAEWQRIPPLLPPSLISREADKISIME